MIGGTTVSGLRFGWRGLEGNNNLEDGTLILLDRFSRVCAHRAGLIRKYGVC